MRQTRIIRERSEESVPFRRRERRRAVAPVDPVVDPPVPVVEVLAEALEEVPVPVVDADAERFPAVADGSVSVADAVDPLAVDAVAVAVDSALVVASVVDSDDPVAHLSCDGNPLVRFAT
jgi:hypothetical protein